MENKEIPVCSYCGRPATHQLKNGKWCCSNSPNKCPEIRLKNSRGSHHQGHPAWNKGLPAWNKGHRKTEVRACPVCEKQFEVPIRSKKVTCSYSCSNKYFRSGDNNGQHVKTKRKAESGEVLGSFAYRKMCFKYHEKKCVACGESKIVEVHHLNGNHYDNSIMNIIPLCPTHHQYMHSRYKNEVLEKIDEHLVEMRKKYPHIT